MSRCSAVQDSKSLQKFKKIKGKQEPTAAMRLTLYLEFREGEASREVFPAS